MDSHPARLAIQAAADYHAGIVDFAIFQEILASLYLAVDDNIDPTAEQIAEKISEMNTASAFISAGRAGGRE